MVQPRFTVCFHAQLFRHSNFVLFSSSKPLQYSRCALHSNALFSDAMDSCQGPRILVCQVWLYLGSNPNTVWSCTQTSRTDCLCTRTRRWSREAQPCTVRCASRVESVGYLRTAVSLDPGTCILLAPVTLLYITMLCSACPITGSSYLRFIPEMKCIGTNFAYA